MRIKAWYSAVAVISVLACGGGGDPVAPERPSGNLPVPTGGITVTNNAFLPGQKTVSPNTTVQWAWNSCSGGGGYGEETCVQHSVSFDDGTTSPIQDTGRYSRTFAVAGTYDYRCATHGLAMTGRITVQ